MIENDASAEQLVIYAGTVLDGYHHAYVSIAFDDYIKNLVTLQAHLLSVVQSVDPAVTYFATNIKSKSVATIWLLSASSDAVEERAIENPRVYANQDDNADEDEDDAVLWAVGSGALFPSALMNEKEETSSYETNILISQKGLSIDFDIEEGDGSCRITHTTYVPLALFTGVIPDGKYTSNR